MHIWRVNSCPYSKVQSPLELPCFACNMRRHRGRTPDGGKLQHLTKVRTGLARSNGRLQLEEHGPRARSRRLLAARGATAASASAQDEDGPSPGG